MDLIVSVPKFTYLFCIHTCLKDCIQYFLQLDGDVDSIIVRANGSGIAVVDVSILSVDRTVNINNMIYLFCMLR